MKLTKTEAAAFAAIGNALCAAKDGVTIGDYKFKLVVREELTAIHV